MSKKSKLNDSINVRSIINPDFMGLSPAEMDQLDDAITRLEHEAEADLKNAPVRRNDAYLRDDIFEAEEKGGESK